LLFRRVPYLWRWQFRPRFDTQPCRPANRSLRQRSRRSTSALRRRAARSVS